LYVAAGKIVRTCRFLHLTNSCKAATGSDDLPSVAIQIDVDDDLI
jgi:hypothetical protein